MAAELDILVCGATGLQGGAVARSLLQRGHRVAAVTRDPSKPAARELQELGAALVGADLTDREDCERALSGCDAAFLMATPYEQGVDVEVQAGTTLAEAAATAGLGHLVYSSVAGCRQDSGLPHFESKLRIERRIEELGIPYTFVEPVYFMENALLPDSLAALRDGRLAIPMAGDVPLQQVAVADIGSFVALALDDPDRFAGKRIEIAGDELTGVEAAQALTEALGRPIEYLAVPLEAVRQQSEELAAMFQWMEQVGFAADVAGLRRDFPEVGWHDFRAWARETVPATVA